MDDYEASTNSQVNESSANGDENEDEYGQEVEAEEVEFTKVKRENVF